MNATDYQTYSAEDAPKGIWRHIGPVLGYPRLAWKSRTLVWNFFRRELFGRFRGSMLGMFWVLAQPMFLFLIYFFVFGFLFAPRTGDGPNIEFAMYLFSGIVAFNVFSEATMRCSTVVLDNGNLVKKVAFHSELLPVHLVLVSAVVYLVGMGVVIAVGLPAGVVHFGMHTLAWPALILVHLGVTLGIGLALACIQVLLRDTMHLYGIFSQAWFFLTPVFWNPEFMQKAFVDFGLEGWDVVFSYNPLYPLILAHRQVLGIEVTGNVADVWTNVGLAGAWAVFFMVFGYGLFRSRQHKFADLV